MDLCRMSLSNAAESISFKWIIIVMIYLATIILSLSAESLDERLYVTSMNVTIWEDEIVSHIGWLFDFEKWKLNFPCRRTIACWTSGIRCQLHVVWVQYRGGYWSDCRPKMIYYSIIWWICININWTIIDFGRWVTEGRQNREHWIKMAIPTFNVKWDWKSEKLWKSKERKFIIIPHVVNTKWKWKLFKNETENDNKDNNNNKT